MNKLINTSVRIKDKLTLRSDNGNGNYISVLKYNVAIQNVFINCYLLSFGYRHYH